ncbi:MAG TPA: protein kinase, partial [Urbifossiella sp.]|nr:protein kinase [Urbifossiella sp.]
MHPSPIAGRCPTRAALAAYLQEELPPGDSEAVRVHVLSCPGCEAELRILDDEGDAPLRRFRTWLAGAAVGPPDRWYEQMAVVARGSFPPPADGPAPPERLGQYQLFGLIGRGGMGEVYRAKHLQLKKWVAVKLLHPARVDARAVARFEREIEVAGRLDHANIVRATDAGRADGFHYLVMELIDGADLARIVRRHGPLPVAEACELIRQAAVGLQHAHEHELVHRDIKPSNLMLSARGVVKVLDLGLARLRGDPTAGTLSVTGQVMGTADYMAPEQWEASHEVDIRADIYSLGCTLFTLLTGSPPFAGPGLDTLYKKLKAHHEAPVPPLSGGHPVPAELEKLVGRMLRKTPALRPQAPEEVARELAGYCVGSDLAWLTAANAGSPPGPCVSGSVETKSFQPSLTGRYPTTAPLMSARRRGPIRVVACLCVLAAAVVGYVVWGPDRNPTSDPDPRPEAGNIRPTAPPPVLPPRVFRPGEWCELLDRPPTVVRWPQNPENSAYEYDPVHRSL